MVLRRSLGGNALRALTGVSSLISGTPNGSRILPFMGICTTSSTNSCLVISVSNRCRGTIVSRSIESISEIFSFGSVQRSADYKFSIGPQSTARVLYSNMICRMASSAISSNRLKDHVSLLTEGIMFSTRAGVPLSGRRLERVS